MGTFEANDGGVPGVLAGGGASDGRRQRGGGMEAGSYRMGQTDKQANHFDRIWSIDRLRSRPPGVWLAGQVAVEMAGLDASLPGGKVD